MKKYQLIIFFDEEVLIDSEEISDKKLILNFRSNETLSLTKGTKIDENTYYCEIDIEKSLKIINFHQEDEYNNLEKYCLKILKCFLEESADSLICFLKKHTLYNREELKNLELEFNSCKKNNKYKMLKKKAQTT